MSASGPNHWGRMRCRRLSRRALLGASARAGVGAAGLALVGCGDEGNGQAVAETTREPAEEEAQQIAGQAQSQEAESRAQAAPEEEEEEAVSQAGGFTPGGVLRVALPIDSWDYMDPHRAVFAPAQFNMSLYMNYLIRWANKEEGVLEGDIGSLPEIPDAETYVFRIDNGAAFWDRYPTEGGRSVTADDIRYNVQRQVDGLDADGNEDGTFLQSTNYRKTAALEVIDDRTIRMTTDGPDATYLSAVHAGPFSWITSPEAIDTFGNRWRDETTNVDLSSGTGFMIPVEFDPDTRLHMEPNANYWKSDDLGPLPHIAEYVAARIVDPSAVEAAYRAKQIDFGYFPLSKVQVDGIAGDFPDHPQAEMALGFTIINSFNFNPNWTGEDGNGNPWRDRRVVWAFNAAVDRFLLVDAVYLGDAKLSATAAAPWFNEFWKIPDDTLLTIPGWRADREQDIQLARALLDAAGVAPGTTFHLLVGDIWEGAYPGITETTKAMYEDATGMTMAIDLQPFTVFRQRLVEGTFPGSVPSWTNAPSDLDPTAQYLQELVPGGSTNVNFYDYPPVTDLVHQMRVTIDVEERKALAGQVQAIGLGLDADHGLDGIFNNFGVMNGVQRAIRWPYVHVSDDWFQYAHSAHLFDTSWLDASHADYPA